MFCAGNCAGGDCVSFVVSAGFVSWCKGASQDGTAKEEKEAVDGQKQNSCVA